MANDPNVYTVLQLNDLIRDALEQQFSESVQVKGEITNWKISAGHAYFTLQDTDASLKCIIWKGIYKKIGLNLKQGDKILLTGDVKVYSKSGYYQFYGTSAKYEGAGDLHEIHQEMKNRLEKQGFFDPSKKKKLPEYVQSVGIITALEGAALQDILFVLKRDFKGQVYIKNAVVQGDNCPNSIVEGIEYFNSFEHGLDVILISRGGGSLQDLIGFSDEKVIKAIHESKICTISAVGHEVDTMLSDLVADVRAPTPSIAAQMLVKQQKWLPDKLKSYENFGDKAKQKLEQLYRKVAELKLRLTHPIELFERKDLELTGIAIEIRRKAYAKLGNLNIQKERLKDKIALLNPDNILKKGYCIILDENQKPITSIKQFQRDVINVEQKKIKITLKMADGEIQVEV